MSSFNKKIIDEKIDIVLIFFLFIISIISSTNLKWLQKALEVFSILYLFFGISLKYKIQKNSIYLFTTFIFFSLVSIISNPFIEFLLNFKIYLLAILVLIYFEDKVIQTILLDIIVYTNIFILLVKIFFNVYLIPVNGLGIGFQELLDSRPLGLFLNPHLSAYVAGIYFIFKSFERKNIIYDVIGGVLIFLFGSKFTLFAYIGSFISRSKFIFKILLIIASLFFIGLIFILSTDYIYLFPTSGRFIFQQMLDLSSYKALTNFYPHDYSRYLGTQIVEMDDVYGKANGNEIGNEIQLFTLYIEGGYILATLYLYNLYKILNIFRIFLFLSLIHYGFVTTPFILFLMINYENILSKKFNNEIRGISRN